MLALIEWLRPHFWLYEIWRPFKGNGYQYWSGAALLTALAVWWRKHNCHHYGCPFLAWHPSDEHDGHPVCRLHHKHHHGPLSRLAHRLGWHHGNSHLPEPLTGKPPE